MCDCLTFQPTSAVHYLLATDGLFCSGYVTTSSIALLTPLKFVDLSLDAQVRNYYSRKADANV